MAFKYPSELMGRCTVERTRLTSITWPDSRRRMRNTRSVFLASALPGDGFCPSSTIVRRGGGPFADLAGLGWMPLHGLPGVGHHELLRGIEFKPQQRPGKLKQRLQFQLGIALLDTVAVAQQKMPVS